MQGKLDAPARNRTWNLRIKSPLLCQLSYRGGRLRSVAAGPESAAAGAARAARRAGPARTARLRLGGVELALEALAHVRVGEVERLAPRQVAGAGLTRLVREDGQLRVRAGAAACAGEDLLRARGLRAFAEDGVGLHHEARHAVVWLVGEPDVLLPRVARRAQPPATLRRVGARLLVEVVTGVGEVEARAGEFGVGRRVGRVGARTAGGCALAILESLRGAVAAARRPGDRVDEAAGHGAA